MKTSLIPILLLAFMSTIDQITLEDLRWKNRVLLVFPVGANSENQFIPESDTLQGEMEERDMVYFVFGDSLKTNSEFSFATEYIKQLRAKHTLGSKKDCYVLIGKDGGTKLRREQSKIDWEELFGTIDAMPMRMREINEKDNSR
ncbi:DUF4174 domain-containing protein [Cyclobacterium salsum]|uniref:DUF4174 domain-containing protein n=1 Tax=Cyclobacterium salsum TaxID=2666329 RepID=UPI001391E092|nr:DUF4174 domain-containing protein [Cyclobacterium salsum]